MGKALFEELPERAIICLMEVKAEGELERSFSGGVVWGELVHLLAFKSKRTGTTPSRKDMSHVLYVNLLCKPGLEGF